MRRRSNATNTHTISTESRLLINSSVKALIYKAAFRQYPSSVCGFILGNVENSHIELALPLARGFTPDKSRKIPQWIDSARQAADRIANHTGLNVVGIFLAEEETSNELLGLLADYLKLKSLTFLCHVPTMGGETLWGMRVYWANRFPCDPLMQKVIPTSIITKEHNPRRVIKMWNALKDEVRIE